MEGSPVTIQLMEKGSGKRNEKTGDKYTVFVWDIWPKAEILLIAGEACNQLDDISTNYKIGKSASQPPFSLSCLFKAVYERWISKKFEFNKFHLQVFINNTYTFKLGYKTLV